MNAVIIEDEFDHVAQAPVARELAASHSPNVVVVEDDKYEEAPLSEADLIILAFLKKVGVADIYGPDLEANGSSSAGGQKQEETFTSSNFNNDAGSITIVPAISDHPTYSSWTGEKKRKASSDEERPRKKRKSFQEFLKKRYKEEQFQLRYKTGCDSIITFEEYEMAEYRSRYSTQVKTLWKAAVDALARRFSVGSREYSLKKTLLEKIAGNAIQRHRKESSERANRWISEEAKNMIARRSEEKYGKIKAEMAAIKKRMLEEKKKKSQEA